MIDYVLKFYRNKCVLLNMYGVYVFIFFNLLMFEFKVFKDEIKILIIIMSVKRVIVMYMVIL